MDSLLEALLQWISDNSSYITKGIQLPTVVEMTRSQITNEFYTDHPNQAPSNGIDHRIKALYNAEKQILYVIQAKQMEYVDEFDSPTDNPAWREIVLHELIHHVQWQTGYVKDWQCERYGEKDAYLLGGKYLKQRASDDPLPNRIFWANIYSRC